MCSWSWAGTGATAAAAPAADLIDFKCFPGLANCYETRVLHLRFSCCIIKTAAVPLPPLPLAACHFICHIKRQPLLSTSPTHLCTHNLFGFHLNEALLQKPSQAEPSQAKPSLTASEMRRQRLLSSLLIYYFSFICFL